MKPLAFLERALLVIGLACLGWYGLALADAAYDRRDARAAFDRTLAGKETAEPTPAPAPPAAVPAPAPVIPPPAIGDTVGVLEIPRLGLSTPIVEGDTDRLLKSAAGHLPDTPHPWENGNSAIAAHRDGLFRPLRNIRIGDEVLVRTEHGEVHYRVKATRIVRPTDLSVLEPSADPMLTLITCYPFNYVGSAPKRFIVQAERVPAM